MKPALIRTDLTYVLVALATLIVFVADRPSAANEIIMIGPKVAPTKFEGPCPVRLEFRTLIMADEFGEVDYRWIRSDGGRMPVETLSLPEKKRKRSGYVTMTWDVAPTNAPDGREYSADVEIETIKSLGSMGPAKAWVKCDEATMNSDAGSDLIEFGETDDVILGENGGAVPADVETEVRSLRPLEFSCPVNELGVKIASLPSGWEKGERGNTATARVRSHFVTNTAGNKSLTCVYQNGRWRLPLTREFPRGYSTCVTQGPFFFRCVQGSK
jgi:hypothetical protein